MRIGKSALKERPPKEKQYKPTKAELKAMQEFQRQQRMRAEERGEVVRLPKEDVPEEAEKSKSFSEVAEAQERLDSGPLEEKPKRKARYVSLG